MELKLPVDTPPTTSPATPEQSSLPETPRNEDDMSPGSPLSPQEAHARGECRPCAYFRHKADGCRQGDDCPFCHLCDHDAIKRLKKAKRQRMRAQDRIRKGSVSSMTTTDANSPTRTVDDDSSPLSFKAVDSVKNASFGLMADVPALPPCVDEPRDASPFKKGEPARIELTQIRSPPGLGRPYLPLNLNLSLSQPAEKEPEAAVPKVLRTPMAAAEQGPGLGVTIEPLPVMAPGLSPCTVGDEQLSPTKQRVSVSLEAMFPELQLKRPEHAPYTVADMFPELRFAMDSVPVKSGAFGDMASQAVVTPTATPAGMAALPGKAYTFVGAPSYLSGRLGVDSAETNAEKGLWKAVA